MEMERVVTEVYIPDKEGQESALIGARDVGNWFQRNRDSLTESEWAEQLGMKTAYYLARSFRSNHDAEVSRVAFEELNPYLVEIQEKPALLSSFVQGQFRQLRNTGFLPH